MSSSWSYLDPAVLGLILGVGARRRMRDGTLGRADRDELLGVLSRPRPRGRLGFNEHEAHLSELHPKFFSDRGYLVRGVGLSTYASRLNPLTKRLKVRQTLMSTTWRLPRIAESLVAYKDVG